MRRSGLACAVLMAFGARALAGAPEVPQPTILPGYQPSNLSKDEQGLWLQMSDYERELQRSPMLVRDEALNQYVRGVACRVAGPYCPDIRVYVMRNPGFNAMMAPNGMMQVWTGLLTRVRSEDELASILGHEVAHYTRGHSISQWRSAKSGLTAGSILSLGLGLATGIYAPVGESLALMATLSFSREQEEEADLLGAKFMAEAGLDPHATYRVWELLIDEEKRATDKGDEPSALFRTHPRSEDRAVVLRDWARANHGDPAPLPAAADNPYRDIFVGHYGMLMDDQIDSNRYGRTEVLLERHAAIGVDPALLAYYRGEMYRQRGKDGDALLARDAYLLAVAGGAPIPAAERNLGYLYFKAGEKATGREHFRKYLAAAPEADDRAMIEFYLQDEGDAQ